MTQVTKYFENMEPGFTYHIRLSLNILGVLIHSDWKVVEIKCNRELILFYFIQCLDLFAI
jgi:hypothetical protein